MYHGFDLSLYRRSKPKIKKRIWYGKGYDITVNAGCAMFFNQNTKREILYVRNEYDVKIGIYNNVKNLLYLYLYDLMQQSR